MPSPMFCACGAVVDVEFPNDPLLARCPVCGAKLLLAQETSSPPIEEKAEPSVVARMFAALLDPQTIARMLFLGGTLFVIGAIVALASIGVFNDPRVLATVIGTTSLAMLAAGWWVTLRTEHRLAGRAITFLACVVLPLNLWFYHAQNLVRVEQHLWIGGVVCAMLYGATVYRLRDPLFMYAVEAGATLTLVLLLGELGTFHDLTWLAVSLALMATASIHAPLAFASNAKEFSRERFGRPLSHAGYLQLALSLAVLLTTQAFIATPQWGLLAQNNYGVMWRDEMWIVSGVWLLGAYLLSLEGAKTGKPLAWQAAALCALAAGWQPLGISRLPVDLQTVALGGFGFALVAIGQALATLGSDTTRIATRTSGLVAVGHWTLKLALLAALFQHLSVLSWPKSAGDLYLSGAIACSLAAVATWVGGESERRTYGTLLLALGGVLLATLALRSQLPQYRKLEIFSVLAGMVLVVVGYVGRFRESSKQQSEPTTLALGLGSLCVMLPLLLATISGRWDARDAWVVDEPALMIASLLLLATGIGWQVRSTTLTSGIALVVYLLVIVGSIFSRANLTAGVYLTCGGATIFLAALLLSLYRDRLLKLSAQLSNREGIFQVLDWR